MKNEISNAAVTEVLSQVSNISVDNVKSIKIDISPDVTKSSLVLNNGTTLTVNDYGNNVTEKTQTNVPTNLTTEQRNDTIKKMSSNGGTQQDIATKVGVSQATVSNVVNSK